VSQEFGGSADAIVIGGGVVGCAVARALSLRGHAPILLESSAHLGTGTTSRNSGVIHAGLYYRVGSRKADTCVRGARQLYVFCNERGVPHAKVGKWVVGNQDDEEALAALLARAHANGATGVRFASMTEVQRAVGDIACGVAGHVALFSPDTGIVDAVALTQALAADALRHGATILTHARLLSARRTADTWRLSTSRGPVSTARVVNAAGLHADDVARMFGVQKHVIVPVRGDYVRWRRAPRFTSLIYPAPIPRHGGLGVHVTIDLAGGVRLGPDVTWDVTKDDVGAPTNEAALRERFAEAGRRLFPRLRTEDLSWESAGIRPKRRRSDEAEAPGASDGADFYLAEDSPGLINLVGIESPGLTAALALAEDTVALFA
jgi:L-2-hydroxyglutarate oxidase LhgO